MTEFKSRGRYERQLDESQEYDEAAKEEAQWYIGRMRGRWEFRDDFLADLAELFAVRKPEHLHGVEYYVEEHFAEEIGDV